MGEQVERLKDEAEQAPAQRRELVLVALGDVLAVEQVAPGGRPVQAADDVQQRRLARARRADDRDRVAALDDEVDAAQREHRRIGAVRAADVAQLDDRRARQDREPAARARLRAGGRPPPALTVHGTFPERRRCSATPALRGGVRLGRRGRRRGRRGGRAGAARAAGPRRRSPRRCPPPARRSASCRRRRASPARRIGSAPSPLRRRRGSRRRRGRLPSARPPCAATPRRGPARAGPVRTKTSSVRPPPRSTCTRSRPSAPIDSALTGTASTSPCVLCTAIDSFTEVPTSAAGALNGVTSKCVRAASKLRFVPGRSATCVDPSADRDAQVLLLDAHAVAAPARGPSPGATATSRSPAACC